MGTSAKCAFQMTGWDEETYQELGDGAKLTRAKVRHSYTGAIEGISSV
jgi:hypothetical protein